MKRNHLQITGTILAIFVGIARAFGGFMLLRSHTDGTELGVGIALAVIGSLLVVTGITFLINMSQKDHNANIFVKMLSIGIIAFWIDGIVNGFMLYGAPQVSGQIINTSLAVVILYCLLAKRRA